MEDVIHQQFSQQIATLKLRNYKFELENGKFEISLTRIQKCGY